MNEISRCKPLLGTYVEITIAADESDDLLLDMSETAFAEIEKIHRLMSFHDPDSELSMLNRRAHIEPCSVSAEMEAVLTQAVSLSQMTQGLYDISIAPVLVQKGALPEVANPVDNTGDWRDISICDGAVHFKRKLLLDLGGIAKGYAVDMALSVIDKKANAIINAGGDLRMTHWQNQPVGVRGPFASGSESEDIIQLSMLAPAVATSATYYLETDSVIISPETQQPVKDKHSFSVFADTCMLADALTKVAFLAPNKGELIRSLGAQAVMVDRIGRVSQL